MTNTRPQSNPLHIAVIGCGLAGIIAARNLVDSGHQVRCFDKSRGVGGRMSLRRADRFEFDHGAQYFTARDPVFAGKVPEWKNAGVIAEWNSRFVTLEHGRQTPRDPQTRYVGTPGMTALVKHLAAPLTIQLSTTISIVEHRNDGWYLTSDDAGILGRFDGLVLTAPADQTRILLKAHPDILEQIATVQMQPCWAVMAGFNQPVEADFDGAFIHDSPISWIARNNSKPGRPADEAWVLHASPEWSTQNLEQPAESVCQSLLAEFEHLTGCSQKPAYLQAHRWRYARAAKGLKAGTIIQPDLGLAICGDWCAGNRVEGAYLSGIAAATALLKMN